MPRLLALVLLTAVGTALSLVAPLADAGGSSTGLVPLIDMGAGTYLGFGGGLYENGGNAVPADHAAAGLAKAATVTPLDAQGNANAAGKTVLLSIGMSNTSQEFCSQNSLPPCNSWTFMGQAAADASVNHTTLALVNGARGGQVASTWDSPTDTNYNDIRDLKLAPAGLTEQQVQVAWVKVANANPTVSLPSATSDAYALETSTGDIVRALKVRYPHLKLVFLSSRIYAGYGNGFGINPEPYAYEGGFAMKWLVQAQIDQMRNGGTIVDTHGGDLNYNTVGTWVGWGPYLWADGVVPRSDGLTWQQADLENDNTHPSQSGEQKVGTMLLAFFHGSPYTQCWFDASPPASCSGAVGGIAELAPVSTAGLAERAGHEGIVLAAVTTAALAGIVLVGLELQRRRLRGR